MQIRAMTRDDLDAFAHLPPDAPQSAADDIRALVAQLWDAGESQPAWCFLAHDNAGHVVGRVGYRRFPLNPRAREIRPFGLYLPWGGDYVGVGEALLRETLRRMRAAGATHLGRQLQPDWETADQQRELLEALGVPLMQEKLAYVWVEPHARPDASRRLTFRPMTEVGEDTYAEAIRRVTVGTLDRVDRAKMERLGAEETAREYVTILKALDDQPSWWRLAYAEDGALVGLVVPSRFDADEGTIGYIGVVPERRGRDYVQDLLATGTAILLDNGVGTIIADTDSGNTPMARAFEKAGYALTGEVQIYEGELDAVLDRG